MVEIETESKIPICRKFLANSKWHVIPEPRAILLGAAIWRI